MNIDISKPLSPKDIAKLKLDDRIIPSEVYESFNELIAKNFDGDTAIVFQTVIVELIIKKYNLTNNNLITSEDVYKNNWLDVESVYEEIGWDVKYDKPGYNETPYEPRFVFTTKR